MFKRLSFFIILLFLAFGIATGVFGQSVTELPTHLTTLTVDDGLSQGLVYGGMQDKDGFIWLATADGLNRYDGNTVKIYRNNPGDPYSLPENMLREIAEDDNGNFWLGTLTKGLFLFDRTNEKFYPVPLPYDTIHERAHSILRLLYRDKHLYLVLPGVLFVINPGNIVPHKYSTAALKRQLKIITIQQLENIPAEVSTLICFQGNSFWHQEDNSIVFFSPDAGLQHWTRKTFSANDLGLDTIQIGTIFYKYPGENKMCILTSDKIFVYDLDKKSVAFQLFFENKSLGCNASFFESGGKLYFGHPAMNNSIYEMDLKSFRIKKYTDASSLKLHNILFKDRTGVYWINTDAQGMALFNQQLNVFHKDEIYRFVQGAKTVINCYKSSEILEFFPATGVNKVLIPGNIYTPKKFASNFDFMDHNGVYWRVKEHNILLSYNSKTNKFKEYKWGLNDINFLFEDKKKYLWAMQRGFEGDEHVYLSKIDTAYEKVIHTFQFPVLLPYRDTRFLNGYWQDKNETFWFATISGLFRFDPEARDINKIWKQWKNIPGDSTSLAFGNLNCLCPDPKEPEKYLWLGTRGSGFDRFEITTGRCLHYTDKDGLANNVAYDILPDEFGNLWISTNKGLSCFTPPGKENQKGQFRNFTEQDGIAGNEFNGLTGRKFATGELFFQGVKGTTWFRPAEVLKQQPIAPLQFTSLSLNNKEVNWKEDSLTLPAPISYTKTITLQAGENIFSIGFQTMDFRNKSNKLYKYYLEGFNKTWLPPGTKNEATYTNLDPGHYVFYVTGTNCDGVWNEKGNSIQIIVLPAWYQTWWFRLSMAAAVAAALYAFYRYRLRQALKLQKLRNRIASDLHDEIGSTLSSISMFGAVARKNIITKPAEADVLLEQINDSTTEMMESMNDIVWTINTGNDKLSNVVNRMRAFAVQVLESNDILLTMQVDEGFNNLKLDMVQRKNIYLIFKEAVNNAAKYSQCKNVWIDVSVKHNMLLLKIKDDGKGFCNESPATEKFGGNGIHNMKKRATESGGKVEIISAAGQGTSVELHLKI